MANRYECKNCAKFIGDCGNHHVYPETGHINYLIPDEQMYIYGINEKCPSCWEPSQTLINEDHEKRIKEIMEYGYADVKEAYEKLVENGWKRLE